MSQYTYWSDYLVTKFEVNCIYSFIIKLANVYIIFVFKSSFFNQDIEQSVDRRYF